MKNAIFLFVAATLLSACVSGGVSRTYKGPERPKSDVAVINCVLNISVQSIDGDTNYHGAGSDCQFSVLPGTHRVSMRFYENDYAANLRRTEKKIHTVEFLARKGMMYYFGAFKSDGKWNLKVQEVGMGKGTSSSDVTYADYRFIN